MRAAVRPAISFPPRAAPDTSSIATPCATEPGRPARDAARRSRDSPGPALDVLLSPVPDVNVFETTLAELRHWRQRPRKRWPGLRKWAASARLIDEQAAARLAHLERRLATERLTIAFVGEARAARASSSTRSSSRSRARASCPRSSARRSSAPPRSCGTTRAGLPSGSSPPRRARARARFASCSTRSTRGRKSRSTPCSRNRSRRRARSFSTRWTQRRRADATR